MYIIADAAGFSLTFENPADLDAIIEQLKGLKKERKAKPKKSWPAFLDLSAKKAPGVRARRKLLVWRRYKLCEKWSG